MKKRIIWENITNINIDDWDVKEEMEDNGYEGDIKEYIINLRNEYLEDERENLNIKLENPILVIANLGLWDGRRKAYKIIDSGNISDILYLNNGDYGEFYSDGRNILGTELHHEM